ncbi:hypothetical protein Q4493_10690 [Colwellia sp. 1_MG-2023]|uniref:hypothetical protein n=1 Tax=Colwellia sp. 1_MG-2023 TaxID=3062649 RepID=UPI0026E3C592|nr:hypothetical protein [Colwellia sp. 1_MG-2023]MDO6446238.1 hypothetical protein [Colwellia sp. 1_MG-2023]
MLVKHEFSAHGKHHLEVKGNKLICKISGAWNLEQAQNFVKDLKATINQYQLDARHQWVRVVDMREWELSTPDAQQCINNYLKWEQSKNCIQRYYYGCNRIQKILISEKYQMFGRLTFINVISNDDKYLTRLYA